MAVVGGRFEVGGGVGDRQAEDERDGELDAVVLMKLQFGQQIAERDAEERAGREGQCVGDEQVAVAGMRRRRIRSFRPK